MVLQTYDLHIRSDTETPVSHVRTQGKRTYELYSHVMSPFASCIRTYDALIAAQMEALAELS